MADYNRCGVPLIEIVTEPDFRTIEEVQDFVQKIALRLKYAGVCDARMEQGSLRVDVNISLMPYGSDVFGTRAELKNINSIKSIGRAIQYEINRQSEILDKGGKVVQETRRYNENHDDTKSMRSKEEAHDYRYFPEPDIPPVYITDEDLSAIKAEMPEMPQERFARYTTQFGLPEDDANLIISSKAFSDFYDAAAAVNKSYRPIASMMLVEVNHHLNDSGMTIDDVSFSPDDIAALVKLSEDGIVSKNAAKDILAIMFEKGGDPKKIAEEHGFVMSNDTSELDGIIDAILAENQASVEKYKAGNQKLFGFFMGQAMQKLGKGANPKLIKDTLTKKLS
jgi:aspartyl-tRNA(Asn)/glutamyl-tRNA(Gln) amidotransferase subunit B